MPRINIDDKLDLDLRFKKLVRLVGCEYGAKGRLVDFWRIAQRYHGDEGRLVPESDFSLGDFEKIIEAGLAERRPEGIYAKGANDYFGWYLAECKKLRSMREAKAAKKLSVERSAETSVENSVENSAGGLPTASQSVTPAPSHAPASDPDAALDPKEHNARARGKARSDPPSQDALALAKWFVSARHHVVPGSILNPDLNQWAHEFDELSEEAGMPVRSVGAFAQWAIGHREFWQAVIVSPEKLREKWNTIVAQCRRPRPLQGWEIFEGRECL